MEENMGISPFAVPVVITSDTRLTLETVRVLMALYWFRDEETEITQFPGREAISSFCGIHPSNISDATTKLVGFGWLARDRTTYTLTVPAVVSEMIELANERSKQWKEHRRPNIPASVKKYVFERNAYRCVKCASYKDLCVDHIFPWSLGGSSELDNLQTLCWDCNTKKSNRVEVPA